jgi:hypothetical protein
VLESSLSAICLRLNRSEISPCGGVLHEDLTRRGQALPTNIYGDIDAAMDAEVDTAQYRLTGLMAANLMMS